MVSDGGIAPAISPQGTRLAFAREITDNNIWRASTHDGSGGSDPVRLIASTHSDQVGRYSPDGRQNRLCVGPYGPVGDLDCEFRWDQLVQLTSLENAGAPSWSPDGQKIVFSSPISGSPQVYAISLGGGKPLQITSAAPGCTIPRYSRDSQVDLLRLAADRAIRGLEDRFAEGAPYR